MAPAAELPVPMWFDGTTEVTWNAGQSSGQQLAHQLDRGQRSSVRTLLL